jgi:hypothetical protein
MNFVSSFAQWLYENSVCTEYIPFVCTEYIPFLIATAIHIAIKTANNEEN